MPDRTIPPFRFLSVCSGIEAASVAWLPLGWECAGVSDIEAFPCAVLAHHYPDVKNFGDFTKIEASDVGTVDLLVGGTPCQDFSVAGLRAGFDGPRGRLTIEFVRLLDRCKPRWFLWENVPGVLSADEGRAFGIFLGLLEQCGYGFAYRVLDAQFFGVPQRRRRVFVAGRVGDWRAPAAVLFDDRCLSGDFEPRRRAWDEIAGTLKASSNDSFDATQETYIVFTANDDGADATSGMTPTLRCGGQGGGGVHMAVTNGDWVRRMTPVEYERCQGFPDNYTAVDGSSDNKRRRAIGNSMAVPVMRWIGERIAMVESLVAA